MDSIEFMSFVGEESLDRIDSYPFIKVVLQKNIIIRTTDGDVLKFHLLFYI